MLVVRAQLGGNSMAQEWGSDEKLGTPLPRALAGHGSCLISCNPWDTVSLQSWKLEL